MTHRTINLAIMIIAFAIWVPLSATSLSAASFKRITTEAEFRNLVVGKKLFFNKNHVIVKKNGTLRGKFGGKTLKGNWAWRDGYICRTLTTHSKNTDCQLWEVDGNSHRVTRDFGKGITFTYITK